MAGVAQAHPGPQPGQAHRQVGHGPGQVIGEQPAHPSHDQPVSKLQRHLGSGSGQPAQPGQSFRAAPGQGQAQGHHDQGLQARGRVRGAGGDGPLAPGQGLIHPPQSAKVCGQRGGRGRAYQRFGVRVMGLPGLQQVGFHDRPPSAEQIEVAEQGAAPGAGTELCGLRPQGQRPGHIGAAHQCGQGIEEAALLLAVIRAGRRCLGQPRCGLSDVARFGRLLGRFLQVAGQAVVGPEGGSHPVSEGGGGRDQRGCGLVQPAALG